MQLLDLEQLVSTMRGDGDKQSGEFQSLHNELQESKEEVSELMRALEDLALNYDQKADALQGTRGLFFPFPIMLLAVIFF